MFFIIGISQKQKKIEFNQMSVCPCCGHYGRVEIMMMYSYLMFFFIPVFKWHRRYYAVMQCCGSSVEIDYEMGRAIESGSEIELDLDALMVQCHHKTIKRCSNCGFSTEEDFEYCPKCGTQL
ncbi:zinc ribbon domain-containing protein [Fusibacter ferrireducens]|uniref:Zinc ribbon domain-containing protein n=1 Tax=Fusibacter ferrireducens TaxID=2785058 RepID=A0ABR9ZM61_9FIRM|nr:zinc ribbon domain-containing protein [Fusibacter ferrireducens]MBF4691558.1 zinc ribbon domain-containing protein [Fusibacter ferrireducens]